MGDAKCMCVLLNVQVYSSTVWCAGTRGAHTPRHVDYMLASLVLLSAWWPASQTDQDTVLESLFGQDIGILKPINSFCVEFGFAPMNPGSNTWTLRKNTRTSMDRKRLEKREGLGNLTNRKPYRKSWTCLLMDNSRVPEQPSSHGSSRMVRANITSQNIGSLFATNKVPRDVDYVSVDIDTADIWVTKGMLTDGYRPRVMSIEYNPNFPSTAPPIAFPDPSIHPMLNARAAFSWSHTCFLGSTARAIEEMMTTFDYVLTNVSAGLDLFFVRGDVWRPRPGSTTIPGRPGALLTTQRCMSSHKPMHIEEAVNLLSWEALRDGATLCQARKTASAALGELARSHSQCHQNCFRKLVNLTAEDVSCA